MKRITINGHLAFHRTSEEAPTFVCMECRSLVDGDSLASELTAHYVDVHPKVLRRWHAGWLIDGYVPLTAARSMPL